MKPNSSDGHGPVVVVKPRPRCAHAGCADAAMLRCAIHRDLLCPIHYREHSAHHAPRAPLPGPAAASEPRSPTPRASPAPTAHPSAPVKTATELVTVGAGARVRRRIP